MIRFDGICSIIKLEAARRDLAVRSEVAMDVRIVPADEVMGSCAWCGKHIPDDTPVFGFGGKARPGVDLSEYEGKAIEITIVTISKRVPMMVTSADSEAKREGKDFMFMVCSEECAEDAKAALEEDISVGCMFEGIQGL
jgi:hypothetical protein